MNWIQTFTRRHFTPLDPKPGDVDIRDIAHSLSLQCRFNGHCRTFYCVADHSVRVSRIVPDHDALWGLMHDAAEAYLTDLPRPVKRQLTVFGDIEDKVLEVIAEVFGLQWPMPDSVHEADLRLLATEARDLMNVRPLDWGIDCETLQDTIEPLTPVEAEQAFLSRFNELTNGVGEELS